VSAELAKQREVLRRTGHVLHRAALWKQQLALGCSVWRAWRAHAVRYYSGVVWL
jgi:hypothetical protein